MKKYVILFVLCIMWICLLTGCAEVLESSLEIGSREEEKADFRILGAESLFYTEEGYYAAEGTLCERGKDDFCVELEDGQKFDFKFSPETIIYAGEENEISIGQAVKVVFYGELNGERMENVSVIAITALEEKY